MKATVRALLVLMTFVPAASRAAERRAEATKVAVPGVSGSLVIAGGGRLPEAILDRFMELAGGEAARIVVMSTAGARGDEFDKDALARVWRKRKAASVAVLHTRSRAAADAASFAAPLDHATGVWFGGGSQSRLAGVYVGTATERALHALLQRGGVIGGTSAGAAVMTRVMIASGNPRARMGRGLGFLPGAVVDQHFLKRNRVNRLFGVLDRHPGLVGLGVDEGTALVVRGRSIRVIGESYVAVCLAPGARRPTRMDMLGPGDRADLIALSRAAVGRTQPAFPFADSATPNVPSGTLIMVGGGALPEEATRRFIEAAGGPDAPIVVIPTAAGWDVREDRSGVRHFRRAGATNVVMLHARTPAEAENPARLAVLRTARGVWFGGGRQWRLVDAYADTKAHALMHDVLRRGGVIGGSSAGASIQAEYMVRGNPLGPRDIMAEGYERGLGFLPGVAIDQHFRQQKRMPDMTALMDAYPQLLGIGIDESTAAIVTGHIMDIVGRNEVAIYDRSKSRPATGRDYEVLKSGMRYDLAARQRAQ